MTCINLNYVHGSTLGYGRYGVELARGLVRAGVTVYDHMPTPKGDLPPDGQVSGLSDVVAWVATPTHARGWWSDQQAAISTMWEASVLPEQFRAHLYEFDTVIVPSAQNVELFGQYHSNVKLVPLGFDPDVWHPVDRPSADEATFRFLIGGSGARKGTDLAFRAFMRLWGEDGSWGDGPTPVLWMKNPKSEPFYGPRVHIVSGRISADEERDLYASAHCYVQPSRGEGFGLQPLQAIAQGCPTILTDAHGHAAFAEFGMGLSTTWAKSDYFIYGDAGQWWEPDFDELCDWMRYVYDNYSVAETAAAANAKKVAGLFTWDRTAEAFIDAIGADRLVPYSGKSEWFEPTERLFRIRVTQQWKADIAGTIYLFEPGRDYYEPADVKRILFEAGLLDVDCLKGATSELGLVAPQVERLGKYRAAHEWCPTCGQQANSGVSRTDMLLADMP